MTDEINKINGEFEEEIGLVQHEESVALRYLRTIYHNPVDLIRAIEECVENSKARQCEITTRYIVLYVAEFTIYAVNARELAVKKIRHALQEGKLDADGFYKAMRKRFSSAAKMDANLHRGVSSYVLSKTSCLNETQIIQCVSNAYFGSLEPPLLLTLDQETES